MVALEPSLCALYQNGDITEEQALDHADSRTDFSLRIRLHRHQRPDTSSLHMATA